MLLHYFVLLVVIPVSTNVQYGTRCGWLYGTACPNQVTGENYSPQPWCIDRTICSLPPFPKVCGQPLPPCNSLSQSHASSETLPTLPPMKKKPDGGYHLAAAEIFPSPQGPSGVGAMSRQRAPTIINAPVSSITIKENEPLQLICSVAEDPSTHVTWMRENNNVAVAEGKILKIGKVQQKDGGGYFCKAQNGDAPAAVVHTKVNVECPPRAPQGAKHKVIEAKPGENIKLRCETNCTPEPHFEWYRDNQENNVLKTCEPLSKSSSQEQPTNKTSFCELTVTATPAGDNLTCLKTNDLGKEKQTFEIKPQAIQIAQPTPGPVKEKSCQNFEAVGCYTSCPTTPHLAELLFTDDGHTEKNDDTIEEYTKQLVCRCGKEAHWRGYHYFGISSYDQCHAGDQSTMHNPPGSSDRCINGSLRPCAANDTICVGQCCSMYVYKFKEPSTTTMGQRRTFLKRGFKLPLRQCSPFKQFLENILLGRSDRQPSKL